MDIEKIIEQLDRGRLALDENETTLTMTGDDRGTWRAWSNDLVLIRKLAKAGATIAKYDKWGVYFDLDSSQVRFFKPLSDERREEMSRRAQELFAG